LPAYAFCFEQTDVVTASFATLLTFSQSLTHDTAWSTANVSGRKGHFRWKDEGGRHALFLERPADGDFSIRYTRELARTEKQTGPEPRSAALT
jgi:hypothetical protein